MLIMQINSMKCCLVALPTSGTHWLVYIPNWLQSRLVLLVGHVALFSVGHLGLLLDHPIFFAYSKSRFFEIGDANPYCFARIAIA